jgi:hypothetical protein
MNKKTKAASGVVAELASMGSAQLQKRYTEVFGRKARTCNLMLLRGEIARKLLECEGAVTTDVPLEVRGESMPPQSRDGRLPRAGSLLRREHDGVIHRVKVLEHAFVYQGAQYRSLSAKQNPFAPSAGEHPAKASLTVCLRHRSRGSVSFQWRRVDPRRRDVGRGRRALRHRLDAEELVEQANILGRDSSGGTDPHLAVRSSVHHVQPFDRPARTGPGGAGRRALEGYFARSLIAYVAGVAEELVT